VLAFDMAGRDSNKIEADIIISSDTAIRNAKIFKTRTAYELNLYVIHGLLHILGYDDRTLKQRKILQKKEDKYAHT
jgi:probable rRNA maturation factor